MKTILVSKNINYIGVFVTFRCNFKCTYCINKHGLLKMRKELSADEWIKGLNRIQARSDLPITFSGGEPTCYDDLPKVLEGVNRKTPIDILTNLDIESEEFQRDYPAYRFRRVAPYASIRVSYHPQQHKALPLLRKVKELLQLGYSIGVWGILYPDEKLVENVLNAQTVARNMRIDFRTKEYLGEWKGKMYGTFKYKEAVEGKDKSCMCKGSEMLIGPDGSIYRCHSDLYAKRGEIGNILQEEVPKIGIYRSCDYFGQCNPCDIKVKFDRYQKHGHCAVSIKNVQ